jgi:hypothetical protein
MGGLLETWGGKYRALIDRPGTARVYRSAYQVMTKEQEDSLRTYRRIVMRLLDVLLNLRDRWSMVYLQICGEDRQFELG